MLGLILTSLPSLLISIIVIAMATLFFCCWGKSNSVDAEDKTSKSGKAEVTTDSGLGKDSAASTVGISGENGSTAISPVNIVVDSSDLGDFSAVSRETEILRSYRKPPPPKNRARQSRAPRALFKSSTDNLDIFAEVSEDNLNLSLGHATTDVSDTSDSQIEPPVSDGETTRHSDSSLLLRPHLAGDKAEGDGPKREDVRSSMLADIEQTLAAMHLKEDSDTTTQTKASEEEKCVESKATSVSSRPNSQATENSVSVLQESQSLAKTSPLLKSKTGPPVSPKPAVRKIIQTTRVDSEENINIEETKETEEGKNSSCEVTSVNSEHKTSIKSTESRPAGEEQESNVSAKSPDVGLDSVEKEPDEIDNDASQSEQQTSSNASESQPSQTTDNGNEISSGEAESEQPQCGYSPDRPSSSYDNVDEKESTSAQDVEPEKLPTPNHSDETVNGSAPSQEAINLVQDRQDEKPTLSEDQDTTEEKTEDSINQSGEDIQQKAVRQDSVEDQTGKGKTSRIPVRAGSKPRSSPPKTEKQEDDRK